MSRTQEKEQQRCQANMPENPALLCGKKKHPDSAWHKRGRVEWEDQEQR
jgi:hypothetical protein